MTQQYDPSRPFAAFAQARPQAPVQAAGVPVSFNVEKAGTTEIITADGFRVTLRLKLKSLARLGNNPDGSPQYVTEFEVTPVIAPLEYGEVANV